MMNFQPDNVGFKRPKQNEEEEEDIISKLPDEILTHILSLLPDPDAYRTRILSKRWKNLCFLLSSLCFKMLSPYRHSVEVVNKFYDFVDKTFSLRNREMPVIERFFLSCSLDYDHNRVLNWVRIVLDSKLLRTLELRFPCYKYRFSLSLDLLMTCNNTLVDLTLKDVKMVSLDGTQLLFPFLKRLKLESIIYSADQSPLNLISACPVLQELFLDEQKLYFQLRTFKISSASLKRLRIQFCVFGARELVIDTPKLEYFYIDSPSYEHYSLTYLSCLVEAHIDKYSYFDVQLLTSISSARILTLTSASFLGLSRNAGLNLSFPNLVKLIVTFNMPAWDSFLILLNRMPDLQHITIHFGYNESSFKQRWNLPVPACLRFMVKEVVILIQKGSKLVQLKDHVTLIRYLLNHLSVLEKLTLNTNDIDFESREKLLNICCRSKLCRIEFV